MAALRTLTPRSSTDDVTLTDWRHIHNTVIPTHHLSLADALERNGRHRLEVAYEDDIAVGCTTVRPPTVEGGPATVISRVLPAHRGKGFGTALYERALRQARELGAGTIETVVLSSNEDGLQFALKHGFTETERYLLPGDTVPWIDLRLA